MKIGIKVGHKQDRNYLEVINEYVDFFEVNLHANNPEFIKTFNKPCTVHAPHFNDKVNFANPKREKENITALKRSLALADKLGADKIIFHPELNEDGDCSVVALTSFINSYFDPRLTVENMPYSSRGFKHFGSNARELEEIIEKTGVKFCLDFAHAAEYAKEQKIEIKDFYKELLSLNPCHFHITDTDLNRVFEDKYNEHHLPIGLGNIDMKEILLHIPTDGWVTVETPSGLTRQEIDIMTLEVI